MVDKLKTFTFKVELEKIIGYDLPKNPFTARLTSNTNHTHSVNIRTWEIEAESEKQVKEFYREAVDNKIPNVRGYSIRSIVKLPEGSKISKETV